MSERPSLLQEVRENKKSKNMVSFQEALMRIIRYWKWFVFGVLVALTIAFLYLSNATPIYNVTSSLIMKDTWHTGDISESIEEQLNLALQGGSTNVSNELHVLKSQSLILKVINSLKLHTSYIEKGLIKETHLYTKSPVMVNMNQYDLDTLKQPITLDLEVTAEKSINVSGFVDQLNVDTTFLMLPALLSTPSGNISFTERKGIISSEKQFRVEIKHPNVTATEYKTNLSITPPSKLAYVLNLSFLTPNPSIGIDFLNTLIKMYNNESIQDNNMEMINTQAFINERILVINKYLIEVEQDVEEFKRNHGLTHFNRDVERNIRAENEYEQQLVQLKSQLDIVNSLNEYLNDSKNANKTIPNNVEIVNPMLAVATNEYNMLLLERQQLSKKMTDDNPTMMKLNEQVALLHHNIITSIKSVQQGLNTQRRDVLNQANLYGSRISSIPTQEKDFKKISRQQWLKTSLFLTLLQMREENALLLAAMSNNAKVLDEPMLEGKVAPRSMLVLLSAVLIGLLIPFRVIYMLDMLQYKIHKRADVDRISKIPIMAEIPTYKGKGSVAVKESGTNEIDEAFRILRTNLMFNLGIKNKVVIFTSTVSGEGKTFIAINTALSAALLNKKVLLVGMDFRIPRIKEYMNLKTKDGLSLYLSGIETEIDKLIIPSGIHPNLDVLPAGPIPPNPGELLIRSNLDDIFTNLRKDYDYIFIDTAPSAQVTDTFIINRISDATVYVCRANYTSKESINFANVLMQTGKLNNMLLVINESSEYQQKYGYGYGNNEKAKNSIENKIAKRKNIFSSRT